MHLSTQAQRLADALVSWGLIGLGLLLAALALAGYLSRRWALDGRVMHVLRNLVLSCVLGLCLWKSALFFLWHGH